MIQQLADAVHYAHLRGVVHGALKPSNILLTDNGVPKITNFGLSILMKGAQTERRPAFRRLPSYMAPELLDGQPVGQASDIYALGAILYKLLTGGPPFLGETVAETIELVRKRMPPAPSTVRSEIPTLLDAVCLKCLAKDPGQRYASGGELVEEMVRFLRPAEVFGGDALPTFSGYEILRELGRGSMSNVYEARHLASGQLHALKLMRKEFSYGDRLRAMLREVAESVSRLRHPNVVQVQECGEQDSRPYFLMELVPGGSLQLAAREMMAISRAAILVRDLARAIVAVQREGIIHGNLKPSKVLLAYDGTPKIAGFILARPPKPEGWEMETIAAREVMGTPRYIAPEQLGGKVYPATDIHALGLILYEMLIGWLPYRAATLWDLTNQILHAPPQPLRELRPEIPEKVEAICLACLAKEPEQRPGAGDLADDLDRFLAS
jgi:serine/threonine protein kinase